MRTAYAAIVRVGGFASRGESVGQRGFGISQIVGETAIGIGGRDSRPSPSSEPDVQISRIRLSTMRLARPWRSATTLTTIALIAGGGAPRLRWRAPEPCGGSLEPRVEAFRQEARDQTSGDD